MQSLTTTSKSIGGYIELDLPSGKEFYTSLLRLNTGRNSLEYILRIRRYQLIYLPYFTCEVLLEPLNKLNIAYRFYHIDQNLEPIIDFDIGPEDCLLYTNYFGIKQNTVIQLSKQIQNLIIDNSQAFFSSPVPGVDTFYSCRKFFGVPDGAYLQLNSNKRLNIEKDNSIERFSHLIKSIDFGIEEGYSDYIDNNISLSYNNIKQMSALTHKIMSGINYDHCRKQRNANYAFLEDFLKDYNELSVNIRPINAPMVYPLLTAKTDIKKKLISNKIFIATYWPNVFDWTSSDMYENYLATNLVALPIDHRYNFDDMKKMLNVLIQIL